MNTSRIQQFFETSNALAQLCQQNGWPDNDTLKVEVSQDGTQSAVCNVSFDEIVMEGAGCVAGRLGRWGQFRVLLDDGGNVHSAERL